MTRRSDDPAGGTPDLIDRLTAAENALADLSEVGGDSTVVDGIPCAKLPVDEPWAAQAKVMGPPEIAPLRAALRWLESRSGPGGGTVTTRGTYADLPAFRSVGLRPALVLPAMVLSASAHDFPPVPGLEVGEARSAAEFREVFCAFGPHLGSLVSDAHLAAPSYRYLVGRLDGVPAGCATVRLVAATAHVFAVAVLPAFRQRGVGTAVSAAATREAAQAIDGPVWLHAEAHLHRMYGRLGYRVVDEHVQLRRVPAASAQ